MRYTWPTASNLDRGGFSVAIAPGPAGRFVVDADDETRIGERYAYSISTGARVTVPLGSGQ